MNNMNGWNTEPWIKDDLLTILIRREENRWAWSVCYGDRSHEWGSCVDYDEATRNALASFQRHEILYP